VRKKLGKARWIRCSRRGVYSGGLYGETSEPSGQALDRPSPRHPVLYRSVAIGACGRACVPGDERVGYEVEAGENQ
jgi:hypothetical protein